jgi:glycolate oxidase iron-sulfur subunit
MLLGCVQRVFFHDVNAATARVLAAEGYEVFAPRSVRCCGALMLHSGYEGEALELAKKMIEAFEDCDHVVVNAAGCGSSMKDYGHLLADDDEWAERGERFSEKVRDVTQLLAESDPIAPRHPVPLKVAYHDACHLAHAQKVRSEPRKVLADIPELELIEPAEWEICCGSAGIYNLMQPEAGRALGRRKAQNLLKTDAEAIASGNPGCTLQIAAYLGEEGRPLPIHHPIELVDRSISGPERPDRSPVIPLRRGTGVRLLLGKVVGVRLDLGSLPLSILLAGLLSFHLPPSWWSGSGEIMARRRHQGTAHGRTGWGTMVA